MTLRNIWWAAVLAASACTNPSGQMPERSGVADYSKPIVLFVSPDSQEVRRLHQELGDDFYIVADDAMWYRAAAYQLLDSLRIPHAEVGRGAARFLVEGRPRLVNWERVERTWFGLVYDGRTEPRIFSDIDIHDEVMRLSRSYVR